MRTLWTSQCRTAEPVKENSPNGGAAEASSDTAGAASRGRAMRVRAETVEIVAMAEVISGMVEIPMEGADVDKIGNRKRGLVESARATR